MKDAVSLYILHRDRRDQSCTWCKSRESDFRIQSGVVGRTLVVFMCKNCAGLLCKALNFVKADEHG